MRDAVPGYRLQALLARGNGYVSHRAEAVGQPGRPLAVELIATGAAAHVLAEAQACVRDAAKLDHPGILPVIEVVPTDGGVAIVTPLAGGGSLADALAVPGATGFSDDAIAELRTHLTAALHHLHRHGLHHGAITAEQVRFDGAGAPLLTGVGTAALRGATADDADTDTPPMAALADRDLRDLDALLAACSARTTEPAPAAQRAPGPGPATPSNPPRWQRCLRVAAVFVALTPVALVATALVGDSPPTHLTTPRQPAPVCEHVELDAIPGEHHLVDVDGSGCSTPALWDGSNLVVATEQGPPRTFHLDAAEGDQLLFADLSCDGREAPVFYRPATGELFVFERFVARGEATTVTASMSGTPDGDPRVMVAPGGCDRIEVAATSTGQGTG